MVLPASACADVGPAPLSQQNCSLSTSPQGLDCHDWPLTDGDTVTALYPYTLSPPPFAYTFTLSQSSLWSRASEDYYAAAQEHMVYFTAAPGSSHSLSPPVIYGPGGDILAATLDSLNTDDDAVAFDQCISASHFSFHIPLAQLPSYVPAATGGALRVLCCL